MRNFYILGEESQQKIVDRINNFIADGKQKSLSVRYIEGGLKPFSVLTVSILFLTLGIICLCSLKITAKFDRVLNSFTIQEKDAFSTELF
ncbi:MAG: hypothetical protein MUE44_08170 [Oscillatoriaceae cyanobacterium Prado104]|jgi:hypothetical protein|nr:hypothetical protein [Oscillatoriaceae cyanobacterium Prado104]